MKSSEEQKEYKKQWYMENKKRILLKRKQYYTDNIDKIKSNVKRYYENNKDKTHKRQYSWRKNKRDTNPMYKMMCNIRGRLSKYLHLKKNNRTQDLLGCSPEFLKNWLEGQFEEGMNWDNHTKNGWHIDHILPLCAAETEDDIKILSHFSNLQPLWSEENLSKGGR